MSKENETQKKIDYFFNCHTAAETKKVLFESLTWLHETDLFIVSHKEDNSKLASVLHDLSLLVEELERERKAKQLELAA